MAQTVVGFFKDVSDVQKAVRQLETKGISNQHVDISKGPHPDATVDSNGHKTNRITEFFNKLFGHDSDDARLYSKVGQQDVHILTVHASSGDMAEKAADILDDCGALDVDEQRADYRTGRTDNNRFEDNRQRLDQPNESTLRRDSSRSKNSIPGSDKSLSYRDDYANTLSSENPVREVNDPSDANDDSMADRGPGAYGPNSNYVDERSYPGDRTDSSYDNRTDPNDTNVNMRNPIEESGNRDRSFGNMGAGSNDDFTKSGSRHPGFNNESGTRSRGAAFTGNDMTNDGISSPDDDQRTIHQDNLAYERRNMISDEEPGGLETRIPTPEEQLYKAKRRSRIINAGVDENYRLRD